MSDLTELDTPNTVETSEIDIDTVDIPDADELDRADPAEAIEDRVDLPDLDAAGGTDRGDLIGEVDDGDGLVEPPTDVDAVDLDADELDRADPAEAIEDRVDLPDLDDAGGTDRGDLFSEVDDGDDLVEPLEDEHSESEDENFTNEIRGDIDLADLDGSTTEQIDLTVNDDTTPPTTVEGGETSSIISDTSGIVDSVANTIDIARVEKVIKEGDISAVETDPLTISAVRTDEKVEEEVAVHGNRGAEETIEPPDMPIDRVQLKFEDGEAIQNHCKEAFNRMETRYGRLSEYDLDIQSLVDNRDYSLILQRELL